MSVIPLPAPMPVNGWFSRFSIDGDIASGAGTIVVNGRTVSGRGHGPKWRVSGKELIFQGYGDRMFLQILPDPPIQYSDTPVYIYAAGAGRIYNCGAGEIGCDVDPYVGSAAVVVEHGMNNLDRSIFLEGQPLVQHEFVNDVRVSKGFVVWRHFEKNTQGYIFGKRVDLSVTRNGWEGCPVPIWVGDEPWLLFQTNTDLRIRPIALDAGFIIATGENNNLHPDALYHNGLIKVVWNDFEGKQYQVGIDPAMPKSRVSDWSEPSVPVTSVTGLPRKIWMAPFYSHSERYGDTPLDQHVGNAICVVADERDPIPSLDRELKRIRPLNMPMIVQGDVPIDPINLNQTVAWWVSGRDINDLGQKVERALAKPEKPVIAYLDSRAWPATRPSWITARVWPSAQVYRNPGEPEADFSAAITVMLDRIKSYGQPMVLTPRFDDFNGSGSISQTLMVMGLYNYWLTHYYVVGFMPFADRRGNGISKSPELQAWAKAFLKAIPARPNRFDYWTSAGNLPAALRNKLSQETETIVLLPDEKLFLLNLLKNA